MSWKLLVAFSALNFLTALGLAATFSRIFETRLLQQVDDRLRAASVIAGQLVASDWPSEPTDSLQARVRRIARDADLRLTIINRDGRVLADSGERDLAGVLGMENHGNRPEVVEAMRAGVGAARHTSPTLREQLRYLATRVDGPGGVLGVARAAFPVGQIDAQIVSQNRTMALIAIASAVAATALAGWIIYQSTKPLRQLVAAAEGLIGGAYTFRAPVQSTAHDEFGVISRALGEASQRLARSERQLRHASQSQATVLEGMSESVIAVDRAEHVLFANPSAGRLLGFQPDKVEGLPLLEAVRSYELRDAVHQALRSKQLAGCEMTWRAGAPRTFDVLATPLPGDPPPGVVVVLRDISELKRLERLRQQFIANVSHELKTPLSSIKAYTETLLSGARNDPVHCERFLHRIDEQAARLQDLILDMLSLARIESGQAALDLTDVSLSRIVRRCVADYEPQAVARELVLENLVDEGAPRVHADEEGLRQILGNLIDNAVKYTPPGGRVSIRCRPNGRMADIEVTDTGIGIAAEHHAHLFERFYRVDKARSRELGGTGLGLAIVKHLCQAMGGSVSVKSEWKKGTTFSIRLPLANG